LKEKVYISVIAINDVKGDSMKGIIERYKSYRISQGVRVWDYEGTLFIEIVDGCKRLETIVTGIDSKLLLTYVIANNLTETLEREIKAREEKAKRMKKELEYIENRLKEDITDLERVRLEKMKNSYKDKICKLAELHELLCTINETLYFLIGKIRELDEFKKKVIV